MTMPGEASTIQRSTTASGGSAMRSRYVTVPFTTPLGAAVGGLPPVDEHAARASPSASDVANMSVDRIMMNSGKGACILAP